MDGFSISILSKGRIDCLRTLLKSIYRECEVNPTVPTEVNLIDDSSDEERTVIEQLCRDYNFNYYYYKGSIAAKRNEAIRKAKYEVVWFVDSDCEPREGVLRAYADTYKEDSVDNVLGVVEFHGKKPFFWKLIEKSGFTTSFSFATFMDYAIWGPCANVCFRKKELEGIGCFKEEFPYDFSGEDVDVGVRLYKAGSLLKCNPDAIVYHNTKTWLSVLPFCRKIFRWGRTDYYLMRDHYDMTFPEYPRFVVVLILVCFMPFIPGFSSYMPILFFLLVPMLDWLCHVFVRKASIRDFIPFFFSFYLKQIFELGFVFESLKHLKVQYLFKKILYGTPQLSFEISGRTSQSIATLVALLLSFFI